MILHSAIKEIEMSVEQSGERQTGQWRRRVVGVGTGFLLSGVAAVGLASSADAASTPKPTPAATSEVGQAGQGQDWRSQLSAVGSAITKEGESLKDIGGDARTLGLLGIDFLAGVVVGNAVGNRKSLTISREGMTTFATVALGGGGAYLGYEHLASGSPLNGTGLALGALLIGAFGIAKGVPSGGPTVHH